MEIIVYFALVLDCNLLVWFLFDGKGKIHLHSATVAAYAA